MEMKVSALRNRIDDVKNYLSKFLNFANCHMVEFITDDYWNKYIPIEIVAEVEENGFESAIEFFWELKNSLKDSNQIKNESKFNFLSKFIIESHAHCLFEDEFCISIESFHQKFKHEKSRGSLKINEFMSHKKSHEVEKMSESLALLYDWSNSTHIVDLGGGKGYLSAMLTMYYNIPVLNIDYSEINHKGAMERNNKIEKLWSGIVKNAQNSKLNTDMNNLSLSESADEKATTDLSNKEKLALYKHLVKFVTEDSDLDKMIRENFEMNNNQNPKICITGLHTCGSLGTNSLKLFTRCSSASVLCTVPCCYNLISENDNDTKNLNNADFPMSKYLKGMKIGRNARMLAAQSIDRVLALRQLPSLSIFYRSLLEVLIGNDGDRRDGKMGKSGENCTNFHDYVIIAKTKLNLNIDKLFLNEFELKHASYKSRLNLFYLLRMCLAPVIENLILLDRLMFLIENGYDGHLGEAFLVKMFDPVVSPRYTSLVAYRYNVK